MNLRFLRTFVEIADNAGFARAATRLNLTQSAASRQIQALEGELGLRLFTRAGRSVRLTSEGEDLLIRSRRLLFDADAIGQRASALKTGGWSAPGRRHTAGYLESSGRFFVALP
jgi:LysR family transcriptional regulator, cyn operon transcriptional activator